LPKPSLVLISPDPQVNNPVRAISIVQSVRPVPSPVKLEMYIRGYDVAIAGYEEQRFCQNRQKHIQNTCRPVCALDRILRLYTKAAGFENWTT
jgi:hypothetical protein